MSLIQIFMSFVLYYLASNVSQFVSILAGGRYSYSSSPIVVIEALVVSELPKLFLTQLSTVVDNSIMSGCASTFSYILSHQIEIKELRSAFISDDSSLFWVNEIISLFSSEEILDFFISVGIFGLKEIN